ncbi:DNA-binding MarR family transcriptional regulator [Paenibacillus sp. PastF-3]|uniref:MarR family winged helix-turn-helix transcriptional regulator n=1 Tax=unclassified Paenibacillus TaxID=185978 RepID=UPI000BA12787|nr:MULTISPECIES: MarR family transcriptional regulator [unclassified Paenibacillus]MDH6368289.1 DNA-binding MarR family transcriptional regulator [Paenibacillus sp. PastF-3]OZQ97652.1 MarR family transcriptional regulator [Paenibacillus sp. VTT E-133291]
MEDEVQHWINRYMDAYMMVTRQVAARIKDSIAADTTNDQYQILRLINAQEQCTSTYLAETFCVGKSSITAIINRLVQAGIIERTRDENDRRQVYLSMSEHGKKVFEAAESQVHEVVAPYLFHFEKKDIETFIMMFEKLASLIQNDNGGKSQ